MFYLKIKQSNQEDNRASNLANFEYDPEDDLAERIAIGLKSILS